MHCIGISKQDGDGDRYCGARQHDDSVALLRSYRSEKLARREEALLELFQVASSIDCGGGLRLALTHAGSMLRCSKTDIAYFSLASLPHPVHFRSSCLRQVRSFLMQLTGTTVSPGVLKI